MHHWHMGAFVCNVLTACQHASICWMHHEIFSFSLYFAYLFLFAKQLPLFHWASRRSFACAVWITHKHTKTVHNWSTLFNVFLSLLSRIQRDRQPFWVCQFSKKSLVGVKSQNGTNKKKNTQKNIIGTHTYLQVCTNLMPATIRKYEIKYEWERGIEREKEYRLICKVD